MADVITMWGIQLPISGTHKSPSGHKMFSITGDTYKKLLRNAKNTPHLATKATSAFLKSENEMYNRGLQSNPNIVPSTPQYRNDAKSKWEELLSAANKALGLEVNCKGMRVFTTMTISAAHNRYLQAPGARIEKTVHATGRAIDINYLFGEANKYSYPDFRDSTVATSGQYLFWDWLCKNAHRFGFHNYIAEWWHWEYVPGKDDADVMDTTPATGDDVDGGGDNSEESKNDESTQEEKKKADSAYLDDISNYLEKGGMGAKDPAKEAKPNSATKLSEQTNDVEITTVSAPTIKQDKITVGAAK